MNSKLLKELMSVDTYMVAMVGYDISHLSKYVDNLEQTTDGWEDGIPGYFLNYNNVKIGYDYCTRQVFGKVIFSHEEHKATEEGTSEGMPVADLEKYRAEIWEKYKLFLFDHTKITDKTEPPFVLRFITWYS